jgi:hypothetical protein
MFVQLVSGRRGRTTSCHRICAHVPGVVGYLPGPMAKALRARASGWFPSIKPNFAVSVTVYISSGRDNARSSSRAFKVKCLQVTNSFQTWIFDPVQVVSVPSAKCWRLRQQLPAPGFDSSESEFSGWVKKVPISYHNSKGRSRSACCHAMQTSTRLACTRGIRSVCCHALPACTATAPPGTVPQGQGSEIRARFDNPKHGTGWGEIDRAETGRPAGNRRYSVQARRVRCGGRRAPHVGRRGVGGISRTFFRARSPGLSPKWLVPDMARWIWCAESLPAIVANLTMPSTEIDRIFRAMQLTHWDFFFYLDFVVPNNSCILFLYHSLV